MKVGNIGAGVSFGHKILIDIGASNPKGTMKCTVKSDDGRTLWKTNGFLNTTTKGFKKSVIDKETGATDGGQEDFISKIDDVILHAHQEVKRLAKEDKNFPGFSQVPKFAKTDHLISGVTVFVPGTTYTNCKDDKISFIPNLKNTDGESLTDIDFKAYEEEIKNGGKRSAGLDINPDKFEMVVTKDLGGTGLALAKVLSEKKMLKQGDYIMGVMTGGGFGSVDIKVKGKPEDPIVEFETSESSSYLSGNIAMYEQMVKKVDEILRSDNPKENFKKLTNDGNRELKEIAPVLGKLGRQGVSVKSHINYFFNALDLDISKEELDKLIKLTQKVGDARIVADNKMYLSDEPGKRDVELIKEVRKCKYFKEVPTDTPGKLMFTINPKVISPQQAKKARIEAVNEYANAVSLISINKINDCINKVVLVGPFAHGLNRHIKSHQEDYGVKDLSELIIEKIKTNIDEKHVDLPSTRRLMELYKFKVICDPEINFSDNTYAGEILLDNRMQFIPGRGSWFSIPLNELNQY